MKKKLMLLFMSIVMTLSLCGCAMNVDMVVKSNGKVKTTVSMDIAAKELDEMLSETGESAKSLTDQGFKLVTVNGKKYYRYSESSTDTLKNLDKDGGGEISMNHMKVDASDVKENLESTGDIVGSENAEMIKELQDSYTMNMSITFPYKIVKTNGKLSKDKKTVKYNLLQNNTILYAYTNQYKDSKKPVITGVKDKASYTNKVTVKYKDNTVVSSAKLDGKNFKSGKSVTAKGRHTVVVKDIYGNSSTVTFTIK